MGKDEMAMTDTMQSGQLSRRHTAGATTLFTLQPRRVFIPSLFNAGSGSISCTFPTEQSAAVKA